MPENTADVLDEIERLEQGITRTLQEIDQSFSNCHHIVSSKILPQIDRYSESSREVYEQAKRWMGFFEAASATAVPTTGRRTRAFKEARDRQQAFMAAAPPEPELASTIPRRTSRLSQINLYDSFEENSTNRPRINSINLSSPRLSAGFLSSSPIVSIPSTPTPFRGNHGASQQQLRDNVTTPDRMRTRAGTVVPRPMIDSDNEVVAIAARKDNEGPVEEAGIGGSKKRSRDGDLLDILESTADSGNTSWASLTDHQREKERLLKSPRKMASVQDLFAPSSVNSNSITSVHQEDVEENRSRSPSRQLMSQIESQTDPAVDEGEQNEYEQTEVDPLLAALATPPVARKVIMEHKARVSLMPQRPAPTLIFASTSAPSLSKVSAPSISSSASIWSSSEIPARITATPTTSTANHESLLTTTPIGTASIDSAPISSSRSVIDSIFKKSFDTGFATSSSRRQTMATPINSSRNQFGASNFSRNSNSQGYGARNSIGPGIKTAVTPSPFDSPRRAGLGNSRQSLLSSSLLRRPLYPTSSSPASRAAASAIASAANRPTRRTSQSGQSSSGINIFSSSTGSLRADTRGLSTPAVSTASMLAQGHDVPLTTLAAGSAGSDFSSRGFLTPFTDRNPPPAPRLGYHSDTIMTQSSLGLNHDGFGGFDSEDQTRHTMMSNTSARVISSVETVSMLSRQPNVSAGMVNGQQAAGRRRIEEEEEEFGDDEDEDEDEDVTENIMRSPCPPGKNFFGSKTDLKSVAQAAASARPGGSLGGGSNLFRRH
ncbi:hypothetical protein EDD21DRAFT_90393 [Dissophora ornata]|nr:DASH complex subunit ask1 [Dissophora ornata]KAI8602014.1 hypothetical protein EDD21DRAFT_90393 [Dissophora ornata]